MLQNNKYRNKIKPKRSMKWEYGCQRRECGDFVDDGNGNVILYPRDGKKTVFEIEVFMDDIKSVLNAGDLFIATLEDLQIDLHFHQRHPCVHYVQWIKGAYVSPPFPYVTSKSKNDINVTEKSDAYYSRKLDALPIDMKLCGNWRDIRTYDGWKKSRSRNIQSTLKTTSWS